MKPAKCSKCGEIKPLRELNGYDPITKDTTKAYCRSLTDCKSQKAEEAVAKAIEQLDTSGMKLLKASSSYTEAMKKHFPSHWPIRAFDFWVDFHYTYGVQPVLKEWDEYKATPCVKSRSETKSDIPCRRAALTPGQMEEVTQ